MQAHVMQTFSSMRQLLSICGMKMMLLRLICSENNEYFKRGLIKRLQITITQYI